MAEHVVILKYVADARVKEVARKVDQVQREVHNRRVDNERKQHRRWAYNPIWGIVFFTGIMWCALWGAYDQLRLLIKWVM